jgi:dTDP-4-amino-4,6-dideoxy-D-galactose acyltransferase
MRAANSLCQYLDWDSSFFRRRIARINSDQLNTELIESVLMWCDTNRIDCLYFLGDPCDQSTVRIAEGGGFRLVDIRVTLEKELRNGLPRENEDLETVVRPSTLKHIHALRMIARSSYRDTRFYYDPNFPDSLCGALYETWIEKSCKGYADCVLVAEVGTQPVGYISCHKLEKKEGQIGLAGVSEEFQGRDIGHRLVSESLVWFARQGVERVRVVTQGRNVKAQRLYQRSGFLTKEVQLWYHRWFSPHNSKVIL